RRIKSSDDHAEAMSTLRRIKQLEDEKDRGHRVREEAARTVRQREISDNPEWSRTSSPEVRSALADTPEGQALTQAEERLSKATKEFRSGKGGTAQRVHDKKQAEQAE